MHHYVVALGATGFDQVVEIQKAAETLEVE